MNSESKKPIDTVRLQNLSRAFIESASLFAAIDLELFSAIAQGKNTPVKFSEHADISSTNADRLMTMCASMGLLDWNGRFYSNAADVQRYLVKESDKYAAAWFEFNRVGWKRWGELSTFLRDSSPPSVLGTYDDMTVENARRYHEATASVGFGSGRRFSRQVDLSKRHRLLDLGGGSGAYSIVAVETFPQLEAVVFDLPPVVEVTKEFVQQHGVGTQVTAVGGDFTTDPLPEGCDVAVMASNLPQYSPEIIQQVVKRTFDALLEGGEMHLIGEMLGDDRKGPVDAALWGLNEALSNSTGLTHTRKDCMNYFEAAGFIGIHVDDFIPGILVRVSGKKPFTRR